MRIKTNRAVQMLMSLVTGISVLATGAVPQAFAANTVNLPGFSAQVLTPASQAATAWQNTIPNALADYYTYQPLNTADATLAGFPTSLNCGVGTGPGTGSDCYIITVKQLLQPMSLDFLNLPGISAVSGANAFPGPGLIGADGLTPLVNQTSAGALLASPGLTKAWGYGSGGTGWQPFGATGPTLSRGNAPAAFATTPIGLTTFNAAGTATEGGGVTGIWHFPAPTIKGISGRPVYVQWLNNLPNVRPQGHDPSVDCGSVAKNCYPYNRISTHVHGAHVTPESDGLAVAWYTPNVKIFGEGKFADTLYPGTPAGQPIFQYPMTQEAGTIWYHDHAVGTTHLNTNNGMAGFFPVTDANEQALIATGTLPNPAFDNGFALQDRHFNTSGQMVMPDYATYDRTTPGCTIDPVTNLADPNTCTRLQWAKVLDTVSPTDPTPAVKYVPMDSPEGVAATTVGNANYVLNFPTGCTADPKNSFEGITLAGVAFTQCAPFPASSATLEYFGNMPVVNGVTYGNANLEARVQRMRFIGGTDSRTWIMQLVKAGAAGTPTDCGTPNVVGGCMVYAAADIIPFWQIGSEQGLLDKPVYRDVIPLMGGERVDVLVDFTGVAPGSKFILKNLGDDAPFSGNYDFATLATRQPTSVDVPEIMQFTVTADSIAVTPNSTLPSVLAATAGAPLRSASPLTTPTLPTAGEPVRTVSLIEITDQYGRTMPTIDARGYIPPGMMTTEYIKLGNTEYWDIVNTTVDAHPMHIHQVAFRALYRESIGTFAPPYSNATTKVFSQPSYVAVPGSQVLVDAWDAGWKDTIQVIPGTSVRVIATWDLEGEYVWHCHILSHEEHDMMRPFMVVTASGTAAPASLTATADNNLGTVTLTWTAVTGATGYVIHESTDGFTTSSYAVTTGPVTQAVLKNVADGTYSYRIAAIIGSTQTGFTTSGSSVTVAKTVAAPASVTAPSVNYSGLIPVTWAASATPSFFASNTGGLFYPVQYLVTYDVTATSATGTAFTTAGITATSATIGQTPDPVTGAVLPLPVGTYTISVVANLASWNPSPATTALNTATVAVPPSALAISTTTLPTATVNAPYTTTLASTGGVTPYTWTVSGLPTSLTFDAALLTISGTPALTDVPVTAASATFPVTISVKDSFFTAPVLSTINLVINQVLPAAPSALTATAATTSSVNLAWTDNSRNEAGFTVTRTPAFPAGFVNTTAANATALTDTTVAAGATYSYSIVATNGLGSSTASTATVTVPAVLAISTTTIPAATVNAAYTTTLASTGGVTPYIWTATGLPAGLSFDASLLTISGTPALTTVPVTAASATFPIAVSVQDSFNPTAVTATLNLVINQILPAAPSALTATALTATATSSSVTLSWTDNSSNEAGFTVTRTNGATSATFTVAANATSFIDTTVAAGTAFSYSVVATNGLGSSAASTTTVTVPAVLLLSPVTAPAGTINTAYSLAVIATGGTQPYTFGATGLPTNLVMNANGSIGGIPTVVGTYPVIIDLIDAAGVMAQTTTNITINYPLLVLTAFTAPVGVINTPYSATVVAATGGTGTYSFSATGLPAGITMAPATGVISGTTTTAGTYAVSVTVTDTAAKTATEAVSITINPAKLVLVPITAPAGTANIAYSLSVTATGGTTPYSFSATGLPAGITIAPATGVISGTPTVAGTSAGSVTVTDAAGKTATVPTSIVIGAAMPLALPAVVAPAGHVNIAYSLTIAATGGSTPYIYAATGLPAGVTIAPATGVISGIPTVAGTFAVTVTVTDAALKKATAKVSIVINPDPLVIPAVVTPVGTVKVAYTLTLTTTGGLPPIKWAASGLPAGLTISNAGVISGTPRTAGTYAVTVIAIDALASTATATFTITVNATAAPLAVPAIVAPAATLNVAYSLTVTATGGTAPYTFTATGLPVGLAISPAGVISGTPTGILTKAKIYTVVVTATDALLAVATRTISITVNPTLVVTVPLALPLPAVVPVGTVNKAYSLKFAATGGTAPYTYSATGLPAWLVISNTGAISGTIDPSAVPTGPSAILSATITVTDSTGATANLVISITVNQVVPKAPTKLTATAAAVPVGTPATAAVRTVTLGWFDNSNNETGFVLERSTTTAFAAATTVLIPLAANTITYNDTALLAKTKYFYRINANNGAGVSAYSPVVTVTTK